MKKQVEIYLQDIIKSIELIQKRTKGKTQGAFEPGNPLFGYSKKVVYTAGLGFDLFIKIHFVLKVAYAFFSAKIFPGVQPQIIFT